MLITTILLYFAARKIWNWSAAKATVLMCFFLVIDLAFFGATIVKVFSGGWIPLLVGGAVFLVLVTWKRGRSLLVKRISKQTMSIEAFLDEVKHAKPTRVPGLAVFLTAHASRVPITLLNNYKHNKVLHEQTVLLTAETVETPLVARAERAKLEQLGPGFFRVVLRFGFSEKPNVPAALRGIDSDKIDFRASDTTFFLGKETLLIGQGRKTSMPRWQRRLFMVLSRNSQDATLFFGIPPNRTVELGVQMTL